MTTVLDPSTLAELRDEGSDLLLDLIEIFLRETPERLQLLANAAATGDYAQAERSAHTLKSSAAALGAESMRAVAAEAEAAAHSGQLDPVVPLIARLRREAEVVEAALRVERSKLIAG